MGEMMCLEFAIDSEENENILFFWRDVLESWCHVDMCQQALVDTYYLLGFLMQNMPW